MDVSEILLSIVTTFISKWVSMNFEGTEKKLLKGFHDLWELQPRSQGLSSPHPKGPGSGWSRVLVTNLSSREGSQVIKVLSPRPFVTS